MNEQVLKALYALLPGLPQYYTCNLCEHHKSFEHAPIIPIFLNGHLMGVCPDCFDRLEQPEPQHKGKDAIGFRTQRQRLLELKEDDAVSDVRIDSGVIAGTD